MFSVENDLIMKLIKKEIKNRKKKKKRKGCTKKSFTKEDVVTKILKDEIYRRKQIKDYTKNISMEDDVITKILKNEICRRIKITKISKKKSVVEKLETQMVHSNCIQMYECDVCGVTFKSFSDRDKHVSLVHITKNEDFTMTENHDENDTLLSITIEKKLKKQKKVIKEAARVKTVPLKEVMVKHKQSKPHKEYLISNTDSIYTKQLPVAQESCKYDVYGKSFENTSKHNKLTEKNCTWNDKDSAISETCYRSVPNSDNKNACKILLKTSMLKKEKKDFKAAANKPLTASKKYLVNNLISTIHTNKTSTMKLSRESNVFEKSLKSISNQNKHKIKNYSIDDTGLYFCQFCNKKFKYIGSIWTHKLLHMTSGKKMTVLRKHTKTDAILKCEICFKTFKYISCLNQHRISHTEDRSFTCKICGHKFKRKRNLDSHCITHLDQRPFACHVCNLKFKRKHNLHIHYKIHSDERPFACIICNCTFKRSSDLSIHHRLHTNEKPYTCIYCGRSFVQSISLTIHERTHTGEKPYACGLCDWAFSACSSLKRHMLCKHDNCF